MHNCQSIETVMLSDKPINRSKVIIDTVIVVTLGLITYLFASWLDLAERYVDWTATVEIYQLDEMIFVLLALSLGLIWFSYRRLTEFKITLKRNIAMHVQLQQTNEDINKLLQENRELVTRISLVRESERDHLSMELHDVFGQHLAAMDANLTAVMNSMSANDETRATLESAFTSIDFLRLIIRDKLRNLKPPTLASIGLSGSIAKLLVDWYNTYPQHQIQQHIDIDEDELDEDIALTVYRCLQEGLVNIGRHAEAGQVEIDVKTVYKHGLPHIAMTIKDDGQGIELDKCIGKGLGLLGIRERIYALKGTFSLSNVSPHGTKLVISVPYYS